GGAECLELLRRLVVARGKGRVEVPESAVVGRARRADIEGHAGVGIAILALAQIGSVHDLFSRGCELVANAPGRCVRLGAERSRIKSLVLVISIFARAIAKVP